MVSQERISTAQLVVIMVLSRMTVTLTYFPTAGNAAVARDAWLAALGGALLSIPFAWTLNQLLQRFPDRTLPAIFETVLGRVAGKALTLLYVLVLLSGTSLNLRLAGEFFLFAFLPRTPMIVVVGVVALLAAWSARSGLEVTGRAAQVVFPLLVATVCLIFLLLVKDIRWSKLLPVGGSGAGPLLREMLAVVSRHVEYVWLGFLVPHLERPRRCFRATVWAHLLQGLIFVLMAIPVTGLVGPLQGLLFFPYFSAARLVSAADFLERIDALVLATWLLGIFLRNGLYIWTASLGTASLLGLSEYRPLVLPLTALAVTYALAQADSLNELRQYLRMEVLGLPSLFLIWVIPMFVLAVAALRGQRGKEVPA
ncbi:MAG TPA: endospore germination permease [Symbiobacteriaceae bacterium]|nr:endospore germination permease [Symbiobacteriaceae bacterium]